MLTRFKSNKMKPVRDSSSRLIGFSHLAPAVIPSTMPASPRRQVIRQHQPPACAAPHARPEDIALGPPASPGTSIHPQRAIGQANGLRAQRSQTSRTNANHGRAHVINHTDLLVSTTYRLDDVSWPTLGASATRRTKPTRRDIPNPLTQRGRVPMRSKPSYHMVLYSILSRRRICNLGASATPPPAGPSYHAAPFRQAGQPIPGSGVNRLKTVP